MSAPTLKFSYAKIPNMGDLLNELILERIFHVPFENVSKWADWNLLGIGSCLSCAFPRRPSGFHPLWTLRHLRDCRRKASKAVWGTGFMAEPDAGAFARGGWLRFLAVRGRLSLRGVEKIQGEKLDIPLGDGGLLAPLLLEGAVRKTVEVGIVPHFREKQAPHVQWLRERFPEARVIDVQEDPLQVVRQIAECEYVLSSSLHGLVVADSFHIPSLRLRLTDAPAGTGFKFDDYYSAYGVEAPAFQVERDFLPDLAVLKKNYSVPADLVDERREEMRAVLEKFLKEGNWLESSLERGSSPGRARGTAMD